MMGHCASTFSAVGSSVGHSTVMAPSGRTPAFSSSWAPALSSTPVRMNRKVDRLMGLPLQSW